LEIGFLAENRRFRRRLATAASVNARKNHRRMGSAVALVSRRHLSDLRSAGPRKRANPLIFKDSAYGRLQRRIPYTLAELARNGSRKIAYNL
jgi:hypothetical protein